MKKNIVFAAAAAFVALSSCVKDKEKDFADDQVSFSAQTGTIETRTTYGAESEEIKVDGKYVQYVDWVTGDEITIVSSAGGSDDYTITLNHVGSDDPTIGISKANVSPKGDGIAWGTGEQTFYAMYPAADGDLGSSLSTTDGMTCVIPPTWTPANATELGQLPYGYMFAKEVTSRTTNVRLTFNPKFSAFCFTLTNSSTTEPITLSSLKLESGSKAMNGEYSVAISDGTPGDFPTFSDGLNDVPANNFVTVDFSSLPGDGNTITSGLTIPASGSATFSVVTLPQVFNDLTVSVTKSGGVTKRLKLGKNTTPNDPTTYAPITFAAGKKHNISVTLPEFGTVTYDFSEIDPTDLTYSAGTSTGGKITSTKTVGGITSPVSWSVEGYYTDEDCTVEDEYFTDLLYTGTPSGYTAFPERGAGGEDQSITFSYKADSSPDISNFASAANAEIAANTSGGSDAANAVNLADSGRGKGTNITESANCYIVNGAGWYKIPLVMGNGVKNNTANTSAYTGANFVNYKNNTVSSSGPYLHDTGSNPSAAFVVWEDVNGLITADASTYALSESIEKDNNTGIYWLKFQVALSQQGNAVIAVTDGTDVMWSYHIWVTDYTPEKDVVITNHNNVDYTIMPINLGWVYLSSDTREYVTRYASRSVYVKLVQDEGDHEPIVMKIERPKYTAVSSQVASGYSPYYQWGRKDARMPSTGLASSNLSLSGKYSSHYSESLSNFPSTTYGTLGFNTGIKFPWLGLRNSSSNYYWWKSSNKESDAKYDLWCTGNTGYGSSSSASVTKTIYDPCPAGYCVPHYTTFTGFTTTGGSVSVASQINGSASSTNNTTKGFSFNTKDGGTVFFPALGWRSQDWDGIMSVTTHGGYWTAFPGDTDGKIYGLRFQLSTQVTPQYYSYFYIAMGLNIRPMRDK